MTRPQLVAFFAVCFGLLPCAAAALPIPILVGQTGAASSYGKGETQGYTLAAEEWNAKGGLNGERVELVVEDTCTEPLTIVTAFKRLALQKPAAILGPTWLDGFPAIIPLARRENILLIVPSAAVEAFSKEDVTWPVSFFHNSTEEARVLAQALAERYKHLAVFYEQEPYAELMLKLLRAHWQLPLMEFGTQAGETDFRAAIARALKGGADGVVLLVWNERSLLSLLQQLAAQSRTLPLATVHDGEGWIKHKLFAPYLPRLLYTSFTIADKSFEERYEKRFGEAPILTASNAYDAMNNLLRAMQSGARTAGEIKAFLYNNELSTATFGTSRFDSHGQMKSLVKVVDDRGAQAPVTTNSTRPSPIR